MKKKETPKLIKSNTSVDRGHRNMKCKMKKVWKEEHWKRQLRCSLSQVYVVFISCWIVFDVVRKSLSDLFWTLVSIEFTVIWPARNALGKAIRILIKTLS